MTGQNEGHAVTSEFFGDRDAPGHPGELNVPRAIENLLRYGLD